MPDGGRCELCTVGVCTVMKNLEKSWNLKLYFSMPGKFWKKNENPKRFEKSHENYYTNQDCDLPT